MVAALFKPVAEAQQSVLFIYVEDLGYNTRDDVPVKPPADESGFDLTTATADHAIECLQDHAANFAGMPFFQ